MWSMLIPDNKLLDIAIDVLVEQACFFCGFSQVLRCAGLYCPRKILLDSTGEVPEEAFNQGSVTCHVRRTKYQIDGVVLTSKTNLACQVLQPVGVMCQSVVEVQLLGNANTHPCFIYAVPGMGGFRPDGVEESALNRINARFLVEKNRPENTTGIGIDEDR